MSNTKVALGYVGTDNTVRPDVEGLYRLIFVPDDGPYLLGKTPEDDIKLAPVINKGTISGDNISVEGGENNALGNVMLSLPQSVAPEASPTFAGLTVTGNVSGITKSMIGLGNVDNTPDAEKPVSRAQREEINKKGDFRTVIYYSELQTLVAANNFIGDVLVNFDSTNDGEPTRYFVNLDKKYWIPIQED